MTSISAVIVSWNSGPDIAACIEGAKLAGIREILVVDNGSSDQTRELAAAIPGIRLLHFPENCGFAGGVNRGVEAASSDYVLILNPDCIVLDGIEAMAQAASGGAAGGMLLGADGNLQAGFAVRRFPTPATLILEVLGLNRLLPGNPVNQRYRCNGFDSAVSQEVDQPPGAFFMVRKSTFQKLGGMDESFWPVWFEDVDFCLRLRQSGHKIRYCPSAVAKHRGGGSIAKILWSFKELAWYGSLLRYATKHFGWLSRRLVSLAVAAASVPRAITGIFSRHKGVSALRVYADVFCLAWVSLVHGRVDHRRFGRRMEGAEHL
jgi:N-acetylglucosaminyl-diphospho-decaprenol L-rhamnosyltransferase